MELRQIRYENLVKDVENTEEDDNEKNNNINFIHANFFSGNLRQICLESKS